MYDYDATLKNDLGAPYILMSFTEGRQIREVWEEGEGPFREARLRTIMTTTAEAMCELQSLQFDKLGILMFKKDTTGEPQVGSPFLCRTKASRLT